MKILLLDTGFSALPIYHYLKSQSNDVYVMGNRADDVLAKLAGTYWIKQDYSKIDEVIKIINTMNFDAIIPGCTDVSMDSCVKIGFKNAFCDTDEVNQILNIKSLFRDICKELNLPSPRAFTLKDFPRQGQYICKPIDGFSGNGVSIFNGEDDEERQKACQNASQFSKSAHFIIEDYVEGPLYSCTGFLNNQHYDDIFFVREGCSANPYTVDTSYVVSDMSKLVIEEMEVSANILAKHLHLKNGLLHIQFILTSAGPKIIELTRRCPGDLYSLLIEYSTGYPYASKYASYHLGKAFNACKKFHKNIVRHTITTDKNCIFTGFTPTTPIEVKAFYPLLNLGNALLENQKNRIGLLFCETSENGLQLLFDNFMQRQIYHIG